MTDPDASLGRLRELVREATRVWSGDVFLLDEMSTLVASLDQSLSAGGPLPAAWAGPLKGLTVDNYPRIGQEIEGVASAVDQLAKVCEQLEDKVIEAEFALLLIRREYATRVIADITRSPTSSYGTKDTEVLQLALRYQNHLLGTCLSCGRQAPMKAIEDMTCAWGCPMKPRRTVSP